MDNRLYLVAAALLCLAGLLYAEQYQRRSLRLLFKPLLSTLFLLVAWMQNTADSGYASGILAGLLLSWIGDFCLIFESRKLFLGGLAAFLCAHISYAVVFYGYGTLGAMTILGGFLLAVIGAMIFIWLKPYLGKMLVPVVGYMIVISLMLAGALAFFETAAISTSARYLVITGALLFYISDILVARDKFVAPGFVNRAVGLPPYFLAQFFFAFSIGVL